MWQGYVPPYPDSGWADLEARRMRSAAPSRIWMVLADYEHPPQNDAKALIDALKRVGGRVSATSRRSEAEIVTITFGDDHAH
jgi:hypothetical protein